MFKTSFFLFIVLFSFSFAYGETMHAYLLPEGEESFADDEIALAENETLDLDPVTVPETTETIGGQEIELTKEVKFVADDNDFVSLRNTALPDVIVAIPDNTIVKAPDSWNGEITPPTQISTSGSVSAGFQTPTTSIIVGSPDVILVFDEAVTILLSGVTGQTAYKTPGSNSWILISGCTGTYAAPNDPPDNGECSISNGVDTKILTFHFTEFAGLEETPTETTTTETASKSSGGSGKTGVGSKRIFGSSSSGGGGYYAPTQSQGTSQIPEWFSDVIIWQKQGLISAQEMLQAWKWLMAQ